MKQSTDFDMRPNLFNHATKELSQDAFITWLLEWASPECNTLDLALSECARQFLTKLLSLQISPPTEITSVKAGRQWESIDIWAEVNDKYLLIIEDKVHTGQHSGQLKRYRETAMAWCKEKSFELVCVYLKTGSESAFILKKVQQEGFVVFSRKAFLDILTSSKTQNHIFIDFKDRLQLLEDEENEFLTKQIKSWGSADWRGFFKTLEKDRNIINWEYVNNPGGGFWCGVLNWYEVDDHAVFMQIEQRQLSFKIGEINGDRSMIRNKYHELLKTYCAGRAEIQKPGRFGCGLYMTIAKVDSEHWLGSDESLINMNWVLERLNEYEKLYDGFIQYLEASPPFPSNPGEYKVP